MQTGPCGSGARESPSLTGDPASRACPPRARRRALRYRGDTCLRRGAIRPAYLAGSGRPAAALPPAPLIESISPPGDPGETAPYRSGVPQGHALISTQTFVP